MGIESSRGYSPEAEAASESRIHGTKKFDQTQSSDHDRKARELEKLMTFDELPGRQSAPRGRERTELEDRLIAELRQARVDIGREVEGGEPDFFEALRHHDALNQYYGVFGSSLGAISRTPEGGRKPVFELTPPEVAAAFAGFKNRAELEREEDAAIQGYRSALRESWRVDRLDSIDAKVLLNDLLARRAVLLDDKERRDAALAALDQEMRSVVEMLKFTGSTPEEQLKNAGRRAEYQTMLLVRNWVRQKGLEHLIRLEHTLPRDDQKFGIDFVLWIGDQQYKLDQKALSPDEYQREFQEAKLSGARDKAAKIQGNVVVLDSDHLRQAYRDHLDGKKGRSLRHIIDRICAVLRPEHCGLFEQAGAQKAADRPARASKRDLETYFTVPRLMEMGLLSPADRGDISKIVEIKMRAVTGAKSAVTSMAQLDDPEIREKIRRAVIGSS